MWVQAVELRSGRRVEVRPIGKDQGVPKARGALHTCVCRSALQRRPERGAPQMRDLLRTRKQLVRERSSHIQRDPEDANDSAGF